MAYFERHSVAITSDADGNSIDYTDVVTGFIQAIRYVPDGTSPLDTNADLTITCETSGLPILTKANIGTSAFEVYPRSPTHASGDGSASLYAAEGEPVEDRIPVAKERIKVVTAQGDATKSGTLYIYAGG